VAMSAIAAVLFLGGYLAGPVPGPEWLIGPAAMMLKIFALSFLIIWFKATYPRLREDQLQRFSWVFLIPLALANILVTAVLKVMI